MLFWSFDVVTTSIKYCFNDNTNSSKINSSVSVRKGNQRPIITARDPNTLSDSVFNSNDATINWKSLETVTFSPCPELSGRQIDKLHQQESIRNLKSVSWVKFPAKPFSLSHWGIMCRCKSLEFPTKWHKTWEIALQSQILIFLKKNHQKCRLLVNNRHIPGNGRCFCPSLQPENLKFRVNIDNSVNKFD